MKRPSFQFYPGDWLGNARLRRCTHAEKGIWADLLCLLHDSDEYGLVRWPLADIARAIRCPVSALKKLIEKGVLKGADTGETAAPYIFTPRHAGRDGNPVTLVPAQPGPVWFSTRMSRDEYVRMRRGDSTRFDTSPKDAPNGGPMTPFGDGPSSSASSSSSASPPTSPKGEVSSASPPPCPHAQIIELYERILTDLPKVAKWTPARKSALQARWREDKRHQSLDWWERFFKYVAESDFLCGRAKPKPGERPFHADLEWIITQGNFVKILEQKYEND